MENKQDSIYYLIFRDIIHVEGYIKYKDHFTQLDRLKFMEQPNSMFIFMFGKEDTYLKCFNNLNGSNQRLGLMLKFCRNRIRSNYYERFFICHQGDVFEIKYQDLLSMLKGTINKINLNKQFNLDQIATHYINKYGKKIVQDLNWRPKNLLEEDRFF